MQKTNISRRITSLGTACALMLSFASALVPAHAADPVRDKDTNTAYIVSKEAWWSDENNFLADLEIKVNGTQILEPLDVLIVLDRSGSMDMDFILPGHGDHGSSSPCLNQQHFYLKPISFVDPSDTAEVYYNPSTDLSYTAQAIYDDNSDKNVIYQGPSTGQITVYNPELVRDTISGIYGKWVVLDATEHEHLYYEFKTHDRSPNPRNGLYQDSYDLAPYHFALADDTYVRISQWNTTDIRKEGKSEAMRQDTNLSYKDNRGLWDHADASTGCFDRWTEAKKAVATFASELLNNHNDNRIALVPFSVRDDKVLTYLNAYPAFKTWLVENKPNYLENNGLTISGSNPNYTLSGIYDAKVGWTDDLSKITNMMDQLFTTGNTDYMYALSMAYNMMYQRQSTPQEDKSAVVVFISDGTPYPFGTSDNFSFYNPDPFVSWIAGAITSSDDVFVGREFPDEYKYGGSTKVLDALTDFWPPSKNRHALITSAIIKDGQDNVLGAKGLGVSMLTVGYMIENTAANVARLKDMASDDSLYLEIPADSTATTADHLSRELLASSLFPGGHNAVLRDEISRYFYITEEQKNQLPAGVTIAETQVIEGDTTRTVQTIVWEIGDIYKYAPGDEPSITVPLTLREEYRTVDRVTYYPTNADTNPVPDIYDPNRGPDTPDTGAKLYYDDPYNNPRYDTIGTPKLPIGGGSNPGPSPDPDPPSPPTPPPTPTDPTPGPGPNTDDFTPIGETPTPLTDLPQLTLIFDDGIPLEAMPDTGATGALASAPELMMIAALLFSAPITALRRRRK